MAKDKQTESRKHRGSSWQDHRAELMRNPEFRTTYEELRPAYEMAKTLLRMRTERNLSQRELAKLAGTSQAAIARLESAEYTGASISTLHKIARALDVDLVVRFEAA